jgi:hypothetical protein
MDRRDFLSGAASASLVVGLAVLRPGMPTSVLSGQSNVVTPRFRGSSDGRIYELSKDGATWQQRANFGKHCAILEVSERGSQAYARMAVQGHAFTIQSPDGRKWYSLDGGVV